MQETIVEYKVKQKQRFQWLRFVGRIVANILILGLVAASAAVVYQVVERSKDLDDDTNVLRKNEVPIVLSLITLFFPNIFEQIGRMEKYHPRTALRLQLGR